jgi:DNA-binding XRE family transcriptional regulator
MPRNKAHTQLEHLSTTQLRKIRQELEDGKTQRQLAIKYGVKEQTIRLAADRTVNNGSVI